MSKRIDTETGIKLPKGSSKRIWRRWKDASSSRERNNIRFLQRVKIFAKKFGLSTEQADQFSFTG
jgi:transcription initiation factor TFIIIB Brf1 subunit/transcription initiation factor TFIIB